MTFFYRIIALSIVAFSWGSVQALSPQSQSDEEIIIIDEEVPIDPEIEGSTGPKRQFDCFVEGDKTYFPCANWPIPP